MRTLLPAPRARFLSSCSPGVPLRSTPGFMLSPRFAGLSFRNPNLRDSQMMSGKFKLHALVLSLLFAFSTLALCAQQSQQKTSRIANVEASVKTGRVDQTAVPESTVTVNEQFLNA